MTHDMKHFIFISALCIVAAVVLAGCCRCRQKSRTSASLTGNTWQLVKLMGEDVDASDDSYTLMFTDDGRIAGKGSCNRLTGGYTVTADGKIEMAYPGSTRMMCPDLERENLYFRVVSDAAAYEIDGDTLMLLKDGEAQAVFTLKR